MLSAGSKAYPPALETLSDTSAAEYIDICQRVVIVGICWSLPTSLMLWKD